MSRAGQFSLAPWPLGKIASAGGRPAARVHLASLRKLSALDWPSERLLEALPLLPLARRAKALALRREKDRDRSIAGGLMMAFFAGIRKDSDIVLGPFGKPLLASVGSFVSLSHSGDYVALAVSSQAVGVDVEGIRPLHPSLPERVLTEDEKALLDKSGGDPTLLVALWTRKESLGKADGGGLPLDERLPVLGGLAARGGRPWRLWSGLLPGAVLSVAVEAADLGASSGGGDKPGSSAETLPPEILEAEPELARILESLPARSNSREATELSDPFLSDACPEDRITAITGSRTIGEFFD